MTVKRNCALFLLVCLVLCGAHGAAGEDSAQNIAVRNDTIGLPGIRVQMTRVRWEAGTLDVSGTVNNRGMSDARQLAVELQVNSESDMQPPVRVPVQPSDIPSMGFGSFSATLDCPVSPAMVIYRLDGFD